MSRRHARALAAVALGGPALGLLAFWLLRLASIAARPGYLVGAAAVLAVLQIVLGARATAPPAPSTADDEAAGTQRGVAEIVALEHRLAWGSVDAERFESRVRPLLADLVAERLRQRHGIDHTREPDRARSIVGEDLWQLMNPPDRGSGPRARGRWSAS